MASSKASLSDEPALAAARDVAEGRFHACPAYVQLCERIVGMFSDIARGIGWLYFDRDRADKYEAFTERYLSVKKGRDRIPFRFLPWQRIGARLWAGLRVKGGAGDPLGREPDTRAIRRIYVIGQKGLGKTPYAVPFMLQMVLEEKDAQVYLSGLASRSKRGGYTRKRS